MATTKKTTNDVITTAEESIVYLPDREARIAQVAYYKAESRGFEEGQELQDWFEAEQEFSF
jgi:ribosomal protein L2